MVSPQLILKGFFKIYANLITKPTTHFPYISLQKSFKDILFYYNTNSLFLVIDYKKLCNLIRTFMLIHA